MRSWRKEPVPSAGKVSWRLITGRGADRIRLNLGRVSEAEAEQAREAIEAAERSGEAARVLHLHAKNQAAAIRHLLGDPALTRELPPDYGGMTVAEYYASVYETWRQAERPRSWRSERSHWARLLQARPTGLGDVLLRDLEPRVFVRWARDLQVEPRGGDRRGAARSERPAPEDLKPASGAYQRLLRSALQALLSHAYLEGHLEGQVRLGDLPLRGSTTRATPAVPPLSLVELVALLDASDGQHRALFAVGAGEGLRPSELVRVRWEDVRWSSRTLFVRGSKTEESAAEIPLTPLAFRELQAWWVRQGQPTAGLAFGEYRSESGYKRALAGSARRAKIDRPVTPYLLRHSFATIAWSLGIELDVARRIMRHTDDKMLREVYCRPRPADLVARVAAFDTL